MDEEIFISFECPECGEFIIDVCLPMETLDCSHCNLSMFIPCWTSYPCLYILNTGIYYNFNKLFGYAGKNLMGNGYKELVGYYFEGHEKEFLKLKVEKDLTLKKPTINPNLKLAKKGTYQSSNDLIEIIKEVTDYIESTNSDKYGKSPLPEMLGPDGKAINTFQIKKYLTRYMSKGFEKSELRSDLLKIIHYAMFELKRTKSKC